MAKSSQQVASCHATAPDANVLPGNRHWCRMSGDHETSVAAIPVIEYSAAEQFQMIHQTTHECGQRHFRGQTQAFASPLARTVARAQQNLQTAEVLPMMGF